MLNVNNTLLINALVLSVEIAGARAGCGHIVSPKGRYVQEMELLFYGEISAPAFIAQISAYNNPAKIIKQLMRALNGLV